MQSSNSTISMSFSSAEAREPHENAGSCLNIKALNENLERVLNVSVWNTKKLLLHVVVHKEQGGILVSWISSLIPQNRNWLRQFLCFLPVACHVAPFKFYTSTLLEENYHSFYNYKLMTRWWLCCDTFIHIYKERFGFYTPPATQLCQLLPAALFKACWFHLVP